jgi:hypothetical protein
MEENNTTKEINLLQLIGVFFDFLKSIALLLIGYFSYLIRLSYKYFALTIIVVLIFLSLGIYLSRPDAKIYKAEATALIYGTDIQVVMDVTKQLDAYALQNGKSSLADKLELHDSILKNIVGIKAYYILGYRKDGIAVKVDYENVDPQKDTMIVRMGDRMCLQVLTKNTNQLPQVQNAVLKYFNSNPVMRLQFETQRTALTQQIDICKRENARIDSLAKVSYFKDSEKQLQLANNSLLIGEQKKQLFYGELLNLQNTKAAAENALINHTNPIVLPGGFAVAPKPLNPMSKYAIMAILAGYLFSLLLVVVMDNLKKIKNFFS